MSWYYQPYLAAGNQALGLIEYCPFVTGLFSLRGVTFAAWTLAAFAIGALAGMLIRRVVPAIAATLAVYAGLAFAAAGLLREHYLTPLVTSSLSVPGDRVDHRPVVDQGRHDVQLRPAMHNASTPRGRRSALLRPAGARRAGRARTLTTSSCAVPGPARVHAVDQLPAGQPVLALPVDRGRLAARAVGAAARRDRVAGPPPGGLTRSPTATKLVFTLVR